jgi:hypothetical protein
MSNPQQPEIGRSRKTPAQDQDAVAGVLDGQRDIGADAPRGPVPPENQPGHHPAQEQDKPDMNAFAERLGVVEPSQREGGVETPEPGAPGRRRVLVPVTALVAVALAALGVLAGRRLRSRRKR